MSFNHYMLTLAREARGLTQAELSELLGLGQGTVSKYETGVNIPGDEFIVDAGRALGYPPEFFTQPGRPYGFPPFHYRKRKKLSAKVLGRIVAEMNLRRMHVAQLMISCPVRSNRFIPEVDLDEFRGPSRGRASLEDVARSVREGWMLPRGPVEDLTAVIEENGGIVIPCRFGSDLIDAMSQRIDGMPVLFFVNEEAPADRQRHTLAHELGHMVLHTIALKLDDEMECEADEFAGAFMLPAEEVRIQLRRFDLRHLANMKSYWKVSMQAIAKRADTLQLVTPYQSKKFWIEMGQLGYRKREPNEPKPERPMALKRMIDHHRKALGYSDGDLARLLCLLPGEFVEMYGERPPSPRDHLRVVQ